MRAITVFFSVHFNLAVLLKGSDNAWAYSSVCHLQAVDDQMNDLLTNLLKFLVPH